MTNSKICKKSFCRRDALKLGASSIAAAAIGLKTGNVFSSESIPARCGPGHVVKVHMPGMRGTLFPHAAAARKMVDLAVSRLTNESDPRRAWQHFVSPTDKVGLKINCLGTKMVSSMKEVVFAIADGIVDAGVPKENIVIFDMFASNMMGGRYDQQPNPKEIRVLAHREAPYQKSWVTAGPARAKFSKLFLDSDTIINIPPIKDHDLAGVTCCMKNVTFGVVEKPHVNHQIVNEAIAHLWALEEIRRRVKLNIIDGSTILYDGGPKYNRKALVPHESIYATTDPVAMDTIAHELIDVLRAENGLRTLAEVRRPPNFLKLAEQMGIGVAKRELINLDTVNLPKFTGPNV